MGTTNRLLGAMVTVLLGLAACGGDDEGGEPTTSEDGSSTTEAAAGACVGTELTYTNLDTGKAYDLRTTTAVSLSGGAAYTAYAADFPVGPDDVSLVSGPEVPTDGTMVTLAVTVFDAEDEPPPVEAGTVITHDSAARGELTFVVVADEGDTTLGNNQEGEGELTVTSVGDTFCAEVTYTDVEKEISGTLEATVEAL